MARIVTVLLLIAVSPLARAQDSPITAVMGASKAIVTIKTENAAAYAGKPSGFIDKATGRLIVLKNMKPVYYKRDGVGVILHPSGLIVTVSHVVQQGGRITVTLQDGTDLKADLLEIVRENDLAFLKVISPTPLTAVELANSSQIRLGTNVYTIGGALPPKQTLIGGRIRNIGPPRLYNKEAGTSLANLLHVDFEAHKGDSGGPVFDSQGKLLGIISAGIRGVSRATFAIPSNLIKLRCEEFLAKEPKSS